MEQKRDKKDEKENPEKIRTKGRKTSTKKRHEKCQKRFAKKVKEGGTTKKNDDQIKNIKKNKQKIYKENTTSVKKV